MNDLKIGTTQFVPRDVNFQLLVGGVVIADFRGDIKFPSHWNRFWCWLFFGWKFRKV
jgi:hypothetical protein